MLIPPPIKGKFRGTPIADTPLGYSGDLKNVRPRNLRNAVGIGQRPGIDKWSTDQAGGASQPIVAMCIVSSTA